MAGQRKRWECRRRRRVCDMTSPACQQCEKGGIACSGYGKNKPVTFLPIGVRNRQKRGEDGKALDARHPMDRHRVCSSDLTAAQASLPRDLVRQQDVYFVNAANFLNDHRKKLFSATIFDNHIYFEDIPSAGPALPTSVWQSVTAIALLFHSNVAKPMSSERNVLRHRLLGAKHQAIQNLVDEKGTPTYYTISSISILAQTDIMCSPEPQWRRHLDALTLIHQRSLRDNKKGGLYHHLKQSVMIWLLTTITIDTTSPASDQLFSEPHLQYWRLIGSQYSDRIPPFPPFPCPHPLLSCLVRINLIRAQSDTTRLPNIGESFTTLIDEIDNFSSEEWVQSLQGHVTDHDTWLRLAEVFQVALQVYTSAALSSFSSRAFGWWTTRRESLLAGLIAKLSEFNNETVDCIVLVWPTIVTGFVAKSGPSEYRDAVRMRLLQMSGRLGYQGLLNALSTLERFWRSEKCEMWDECFERCGAYIA